MLQDACTILPKELCQFLKFVHIGDFVRDQVSEDLDWWIFSEKLLWGPMGSTWDINVIYRGCSSFKSGIGTEQGRTPRFEAGRNKIVLLGRYQLPSHRKTQHNSYPRYHFIYVDIISFTGTCVIHNKVQNKKNIFLAII